MIQELHEEDPFRVREHVTITWDDFMTLNFYGVREEGYFYCLDLALVQLWFLDQNEKPTFHHGL